MSLPHVCHVSELVRQVRDCTLALLDRTPEDWLLWSPPGLSNHILWHAGHVLWVQEVLAIEPLGGPSELPEGWAETFGQDCRPVRETNTWPSAATVRAALLQQQQRMLTLLSTASAAPLLDVNAPAADWNLPQGILHGLHDEARHQGEMHLLFKLRSQRK